MFCLRGATEAFGGLQKQHNNISRRSKYNDDYDDDGGDDNNSSAVGYASLWIASLLKFYVNR
jgi:hypothetical protein